MLNEFRKTASHLQKTIVMPEGSDARTIDAAAIIAKDAIAKLILLGDAEKLALEMKSRAVELGEACVIIDPNADPRLHVFGEIYYKLRKDKDKELTLESAQDKMRDPLYFGAMLVREGYADGFVAGAENTTASVLRAGLRVVGMKTGNKTVSSCFIMLCDKPEFGHNGVLLFADCAVNPDPNAEMLADIAIATAGTFESFLHTEPYVALLSYSTMGSAEGASIGKVREALDIVKAKAPQIKIDGEIQLDAAIVPKIAARKTPNSQVAGKANVLIFPNLDAGNIGYKLVEQFAGAEAIGPIIQGFKKPINDLSRGCKVQDIVNTVAFTCIQADAVDGSAEQNI